MRPRSRVIKPLLNSGVATPLFNNGLLTLDGGRIKLTDRGLEMADSVFAEFV